MGRVLRFVKDHPRTTQQQLMGVSGYASRGAVSNALKSAERQGWLGRTTTRGRHGFTELRIHWKALILSGAAVAEGVGGNVLTRITDSVRTTYVPLVKTFTQAFGSWEEMRQAAGLRP
jgi:hypothetical protein